MKTILMWLVLWIYVTIGAGVGIRAYSQHREMFPKSWPGLIFLSISWPVTIGVILMDLNYKFQEDTHAESEPSRTA